jgi:hypothetical protein
MTLDVRRRLGETVLSRLRREIPEISAHLGEEYEKSSEPEAVKYREIGGKFSWVAFGFAPWRFWDLHVGVVEVDEDKLSLGFHISERAAPKLRPELEKLASEIGTTVIHQNLAVEYQANFPAAAANDAHFEQILDCVIESCRRFAPVARRFTAM